jgi:hypothetical protein
MILNLELKFDDDLSNQLTYRFGQNIRINNNKNIAYQNVKANDKKVLEFKEQLIKLIEEHLI